MKRAIPYNFPWKNSPEKDFQDKFRKSCVPMFQFQHNGKSTSVYFYDIKVSYSSEILYVMMPMI